MKGSAVAEYGPGATNGGRPALEPTSPAVSGAAGNGRRAARVVVADDHAVVREGLRAVLEAEGGVEVVGEAEDGREAVGLAEALRPDLVLMDVRMPGLDGLGATRLLKRRLPGVAVVVVTMHENPDYLLEAVRAGAAGYVLKDATGEGIAAVVKRTLAGESPLEEGLAMQLLTRLANGGTDGGGGSREGLGGAAGNGSSAVAAPPARTAVPGRPEGLPEELTEREVEVLRLLARGMTNPQIARAMLYSVSTIKAAVQGLTAKLGVSDRTQAAVRAIELGLASSGVEG